MSGNEEYTELSREALYAQVWAESMTKLAHRYGLSDRGLAKICNRMGIPVPGRGYWAKVQNGQVPPQTPLPEIKPGQRAVVVIQNRAERTDETEELQEVAEQLTSEMHHENWTSVPDELVDVHPLVAKTAKSLRGARANDYGIARLRANRCLDIRVGKESLEPATCIMDVLIKALEARGIELIHDDKDKAEGITQLVVDNENMGFHLEEKSQHEKYQPTPAEKRQLAKDPFYRYRLPNDKYFPSGNLILMLDIGWWGRGLRGTWSVGKRQRVETCLNKFIVAAYKAAAAKKADRIERERQKREWQE